jgi:putative hydrolase of the HAD superfamily
MTRQAADTRRRADSNEITGTPAEPCALTLPEHAMNKDYLLTPQNFTGLHEQAQSGDSSAAELFLKGESALFTCHAIRDRRHFARTWIFDADDTLWEDNLYYEQIIGRLLDYFQSQRADIDRSSLRRVIDEVEHETIAQVGFGATGFARSLEVASERISQSLGLTAPPREMFDSVLPILTSIPKEIPAQTLETLKQLQARGDGLILLTQGPLAVQQGKIARSAISHFFDMIAISGKKDEDTFRAVIALFPHSGGEFVVVGNSLRSEIRPAVNLGLRAVHYLNPNTWHAGNVVDVPKDKYLSVTRLPELLDLAGRCDSRVKDLTPTDPP